MKNGWLDRRGKCYECIMQEHEDLAEYLQKELDLNFSLEYLGWIRIYDGGESFFTGDEGYDRGHMRPTSLQLRWLDRNGHLLIGYNDPIALKWKK